MNTAAHMPGSHEPSSWFEVVVASKTEGAKGIQVFRLEPVDNPALPSFAAGDHVEVRIGDVIRHYSLSNAPGDTDHYRLGVLVEEKGRGGSKAMSALQAGERLAIRGPHTNFPLNHATGLTILLAGGIGITPIIAMAQQLWADGRPFELHYCIQARDRAAFLDELQSGPFADQVHLHCDAESPAGRPDLEAILGPRSDDAHLYICGPAAMIDAAVAVAEQAGWAKPHIHLERFTTAPVVGDNNGFWVRIASTGETVTVPPDKTVVQALRAAGIRIEVSCEAGVCGYCITGVLQGEPDHRDSVLTDEEHESGELFTPCCSRAKSEGLVLDL